MSVYKKKQDSQTKLNQNSTSPIHQNLKLQHNHQDDKQNYQQKSFFNVDHQQLHNYFNQKIHKSSKKNLQPENYAVTVCNHLQDINCKLQDQIFSGFFNFNSQEIGKKKIKDLLVQQKISKEQQKAIQLKVKRQAVQNQLKILDMQIGFSHAHSNINLHSSRVSPKNQETQINSLNVNLQLFAPNLLTKQQHHKMIEKFVKERRQAAFKRKRFQSQFQKKVKDNQQHKKKQEQQQIQKQKQQRRKKIQQKLKQNEQQHSKRLIQQQINRKKLFQIQQKKFLYQEFQERYNSHVIIPQLQQKKKKLKELRQFNQGFDIDTIKNHQKQYLRKREMSLQNHSNSRTQENLNWNYKPPQKSQRLVKMLEDQKVQARKKLEQKKRALDQRINKQESYVRHLKQKFVPRISSKKRQQIQNRLKKEEKSNKNTQDTSKVLGINYLQQAKRLARKYKSQRPNSNTRLINKQQVTQQSQNSKIMIKKRSNTNYLISDKNKQQYQQIRRKRLQRIVRQDGDARQKIKVLQMQAQRVTQQAKRKQYLSKHAKNQDIHQEAVDLLLTSIKAKMSIMDIYKNSSQ